MLMKYGAATVRTTIDANRIATLDFTGPVTPAVNDAARRDYLQFAVRTGAHAVVVRLDRSAGVFGPWGPGTLTTAERRVMQKIIGAIVAPSNLSTVECFCQQMTELGMHRRVFPTYEPALAWATRIGLALRPFEEDGPPQRASPIRRAASRTTSP